MTNEELCQAVLEHLGGKDNVASATNCMTRLRIHVIDDTSVDDEALAAVEGVAFLAHDQSCYVEVVVGPGTSRQCIDILRGLGIPASAAPGVTGDWQDNKATVRSGHAGGRMKRLFRTFGEIFAPLIPGVIAAGLCTGLAALLAQAVPNYADIPVWNVVYSLLSLVNASFMAYITAWVGYRSAERFGGTPILGGMLGMVTMLEGINDIALAVGLFNEAQPLAAVLRAGRGGVLAVVLGVWVMCRVERFVRSKMPEALDVVFTPLVTLLVTLVPYVFVVMPLTGLLSTWLCEAMGAVAMSPDPMVRMVAGFVGASLFLPMVATGMHHGLVALYAIQLEELGHVTLYPALAMAGAGQVGAAAALYIKAKAVGNQQLCRVIAGALPAGVLGVGEPLIYGVTLPMGRPFFTAGLGAGFGGAFVTLMEVAATTWGPSGLLGVFVMTDGPGGPRLSVIRYLMGLTISVVMGFAFTWFAVKREAVAEA